MSLLHVVVVVFRVFPVGQVALATENLARRQRMAILRQSVTHPKLRQRDRVLCVWLSRLWQGGRSSLVLVQPETVIR